MSDLAGLRARHTADALAMVPAMIDRLSWDTERMAAHRTAELRGLLRHAIDFSPWHRKRLAGVTPESFELSDLAELPAMTKADLAANFDEIVTDERVHLADVRAHLAAGSGDYLLESYIAVATGGSTGERAVVLHDWDGFAAVWVSFFRDLLRARRVQPELAGRQITVAFVTAVHPTHVSTALALTFDDPGLRKVPAPITLPMAAIVERLNEAQPDVLMGYASSLQMLVSEAQAGRLRIAPHRIVSTGDPLLPEIRAALARTWSVPVVNTWGASECGGLSMPCDAGNLHLIDDVAIVEPVDELGRSITGGQRSAKVYVTSLINRVMPLIRYEITDELALLPGVCGCGWSARLIGDVQGRFDDVFRYGDLTVHPHVFRSTLGKRDAIGLYEVRQTLAGADVAVCTCGPLDLDELSAELRTALSVLGLADPHVNVTVVDRIDRLPHTGKLKRFVPLP